jgi:ribosomal protein L5
MKKQLFQWHTSTFQRYALTCSVAQPNLCAKLKNKHSVHSYANTHRPGHPSRVMIDTQPQINFCHGQYWYAIEKICLHVNSKQLLSQIELYNTFYQTLSCISAGQSPQQVKSKRSLAAYKVIKGHTMGASSNLRKHKMLGFNYKWFFIAPSLNGSKSQLKSKLTSAVQSNLSIGVDNIFIFELDRLNYSTFETMAGLDITFCLKSPKPDNLRVSS